MKWWQRLECGWLGWEGYTLGHVPSLDWSSSCIGFGISKGIGLHSVLPRPRLDVGWFGISARPAGLEHLNTHTHAHKQHPAAGGTGRKHEPKTVKIIGAIIRFLLCWITRLMPSNNSDNTFTWTLKNNQKKTNTNLSLLGTVCYTELAEETHWTLTLTSVQFQLHPQFVRVVFLEALLVLLGYFTLPTA